MEWRYLKQTYDQGIGFTPLLQQTFDDRYQTHVLATGRFLLEAAVFVRSSTSDDSYEWFFTPQAAQLLAPVVAGLGATPCDAPRRYVDGDESRGLALIVGDARAWELVK